MESVAILKIALTRKKDIRMTGRGRPRGSRIEANQNSRIRKIGRISEIVPIGFARRSLRRAALDRTDLINPIRPQTKSSWTPNQPNTISTMEKPSMKRPSDAARPESETAIATWFPQAFKMPARRNRSAPISPHFTDVPQNDTPDEVRTAKTLSPIESCDIITSQTRIDHPEMI